MAGSQKLDVKFSSSGAGSVITSLIAVANGITGVATAAGKLANSTSRSFVRAQRGVTQFGEAVTAVSRSLTRAAGGFGIVRRSFDSLTNVIRGLYGTVSSYAVLIGAIGVAVGATLGQSIIDADVALASLRISLEQVTGSTKGADAEIDSLRKTAKTFGVEISQVGVPFSQFANAVKSAGGSLETSRTVFLGVTEAGLALGSSSEQLGRVLTQLSQIASKNKVSLEDLGAISESLPGTIGLAAQAIGKTTAEFTAMVTAGTIDAIPFLEKFGRVLQTKFAAGALKAADDVQSSQARFRNSIQRTKELFAQGGFADAAKKAFDQITAAVDRFNSNGSALAGGGIIGRGIDFVGRKITQLVARFSDVAKNETLIDAIGKAFKTVGNFARAAANFVRAFFTGLTGAEETKGTVLTLTDAFFDLSKSILAASQNPKIVAFGKTIGDVLNFIIGNVTELIGYLTALEPSLKAILDFVDKFFGGSALAKTGLKTVADAVINTINNITKAISEDNYTTSPLVNFFVALVRVVRDTIKLFGSLIKSTGSSIGGALIEGIRAAAVAFDQLDRIILTITGRSQGLGKDFVAPGLVPAARAVVDAFDAISGAISGVVQKVSGIRVVQDTLAFVRRNGVDFLSKGFDVLKATVKGAFNFVTSLIPAIGVGIEQVSFRVRAIGGIIYNAFKQAFDGVTGLVGKGGFTRIFANLQADIQGVFSFKGAESASNVLFRVIYQIRDALVAVIDKAIVITNVLLPPFIKISGVIIGAAGALVNLLIPALDAIVNNISFGYFDSFAESIIITTATVYGLSVAFGVLGAVMDAIVATVAFLASPLAIIIAGVATFAAGIAVIIANFRSGGEIADRFFLAVNEKFSKFFSYLGSVAKNAFQSVFDAWTGVIDRMGAALRQFAIDGWNSFKSIFIDPFVRFGKRIGSLIGLGGGNAAANDNAKVPGYKAGGEVRGPGTGTSDSILARVAGGLIRIANGEYIVNAKAAKRNRPLLDAMNFGRLPRYARGGPIGARAVGAGAGVGGDTTYVNYSLDGIETPTTRYDGPANDFVREMRERRFGRARSNSRYRRG